ncbi:MAG TPA: GtrA family protein [Microvirga sp.]
MLDQPFIRFLMTGGLAAAVNVGTRWLLDFVMPFQIAVAVAYLAGMTTAFVLARRYVFEDSPRAPRDQYLRFALVNAVAFVQVWLVSVGLARLLFPAMGFTWHADTIAHLVGVLSPVVTSYFGHKHFSFAGAPVGKGGAGG